MGAQRFPRSAWTKIHKKAVSNFGRPPPGPLPREAQGGAARGSWRPTPGGAKRAQGEPQSFVLAAPDMSTQPTHAVVLLHVDHIILK